MILLAVIIIFGFGLLVSLGRAWRYWRRRKARRPAQQVTRCKCGYAMDQLDTIRCPECGRIHGFDATAEELELTPEQLRQAKAKRDARRSLAEQELS